MWRFRRCSRSGPAPRSRRPGREGAQWSGGQPDTAQPPLSLGQASSCRPVRRRLAHEGPFSALRCGLRGPLRHWYGWGAAAVAAAAGGRHLGAQAASTRQARPCRAALALSGTARSPTRASAAQAWLWRCSRRRGPALPQRAPDPLGGPLLGQRGPPPRRHPVPPRPPSAGHRSPSSSLTPEPWPEPPPGARPPLPCLPSRQPRPGPPPGFVPSTPAGRPAGTPGMRFRRVAGTTPSSMQGPATTSTARAPSRRTARAVCRRARRSPEPPVVAVCRAV